MGHTIESFTIEKTPNKIQKTLDEREELTRQWKESDF